MSRITFLVHKGKEYTVRKYLRSWGGEIASRVTVRNYPNLRSTGRTPWKRLSQAVRSWRLGTLDGPPAGEEGQIYVFTDVDRLNPAETASAVDLWQRLAEHPRTLRLFNHPTRCLGRFELLRLLHERGLNRFAVHRAGFGVEPRRWPVLLRDEDDHGYMSPLLHSPRELEQALAASKEDLADKIVVEFCDTADSEGIVRKYGAFKVGERILARQIHFSRQWLVRFPDLKEPETAREELHYVQNNPHAEELREIFRLARIDYGRIDYSLAAGRIQVWEINTNPMILIPADRDDSLRRDAHDAFGRAFTAVLQELLGADLSSR